MSQLTLEPATADDIPGILGFIRQLAEYEKEPDAVEATEEDIHQALFGPHANAHGLMCRQDGTDIGFAIYFYNFSTWTGKRGLYLEDLYINPESRGLGAGKAMLAQLARIAVDNDCRRFEWSVLDWNTPSIRFYDSLGASPLSEWIGYRLDGAALTRLAAQAPHLPAPDDTAYQHPGVPD